MQRRFVNSMCILTSSHQGFPVEKCSLAYFIPGAALGIYSGLGSPLRACERGGLSNANIYLIPELVLVIIIMEVLGGLGKTYSEDQMNTKFAGLQRKNNRQTSQIR